MVINTRKALYKQTVYQLLRTSKSLRFLDSLKLVTKHSSSSSAVCFRKWLALNLHIHELQEMSVPSNRHQRTDNCDPSKHCMSMSIVMSTCDDPHHTWKASSISTIPPGNALWRWYAVVPDAVVCNVYLQNTLTINLSDIGVPLHKIILSTWKKLKKTFWGMNPNFLWGTTEYMD